MYEMCDRHLVIKLLVTFIYFAGVHSGASSEYGPLAIEDNNIAIPQHYHQIDREFTLRPHIVRLNVPLYPYSPEPKFLAYDDHPARTHVSQLSPEPAPIRQVKENLHEEPRSNPEGQNPLTEESKTPAHYDYGYSVSDPHTGDSKTQYETRRGDVVKGSYSVVDADGSKRIVEYTADPKNGFNAVVRKEKPSTPQVEVDRHEHQAEIQPVITIPRENYKKATQVKKARPIAYPSKSGTVRDEFISIPDERFKEYRLPLTQHSSPARKTVRIDDTNTQHYAGGAKDIRPVYFKTVPIDKVPLQYFPTGSAVRIESPDIQQNSDFGRRVKPAYFKTVPVEESKVIKQTHVRSRHRLPTRVKSVQNPGIDYEIALINTLPSRSYPTHAVIGVPQKDQSDILTASSQGIGRYFVIPVAYREGIPQYA